MHTLTSKLERGAKALQFDVCCKAIDQNFDCGCTVMQYHLELYYELYLFGSVLECGPPKLSAPPIE